MNARDLLSTSIEFIDGGHLCAADVTAPSSGGGPTLEQRSFRLARLVAESGLDDIATGVLDMSVEVASLEHRSPVGLIDQCHRMARCAVASNNLGFTNISFPECTPSAPEQIKRLWAMHCASEVNVAVARRGMAQRSTASQRAAMDAAIARWTILLVNAVSAILQSLNEGASPDES